MCGIVGIAGPLTQNAAEPRIHRMLERIAHRGPDGRGDWIVPEQKIALGHTRLAILDTSDAARQPLHDGDLHCVVNGEIYNYPELRAELETHYGAQFQTHCDSEIVLHGYRHEGRAFFARMNGMFAIALYDARAGTLMLLRDRVGIKPLYYCYRDGNLVFASEIKALLAAFDVAEWEIDPLALSQYLAYQTALDGRTLFADVQLLPPGYLLELSPSAFTPTQSALFYTPESLTESPMTFAEAVAQFGTTFAASVRRHLLSDVPVASYISAGFDSASVAAEAAHANPKTPLTSFTGRFSEGEGWYDETTVAAEAVRNFHGEHVAVDITAADFTTHLDALIDALDEPKMGMGAFSQYMVARTVAKRFKVILTGHGGDELFSGYPIFKLARRGWWRSFKRLELPHLVYFLLSAIKQRFSPEFGWNLPVLWSLRAQKKLFGRSIAAPQPWAPLAAITAPCTRLVDRIYRTYLDVYLPNLLIVEDKISMAHSLESRTPFLDNAMLSLSLRMPQSVKLDRGILKAVVKENARHLLPSSYFTQPKRGFPTPLRHWLRGPLKGILRTRLLAPDSPLTRLFDPTALAREIHAYETSPLRHIRPLDEIQSHRMWQLLSLEAWLRIWQTKYGITLVLR